MSTALPLSTESSARRSRVYLVWFILGKSMLALPDHHLLPPALTSIRAGFVLISLMSRIWAVPWRFQLKIFLWLVYFSVSGSFKKESGLLCKKTCRTWLHRLLYQKEMWSSWSSWGHFLTRMTLFCYDVSKNVRWRAFENLIRKAICHLM